MAKCKCCGKEMSGEDSIEYCDGYCVNCYENGKDEKRRAEGE